MGGTAVGNTVRADATGLPVDGEPACSSTPRPSPHRPPGEWGNAGRNTIPGPTVFFLNGSVGRIFRIGERRSIDLQLQAQNVLNHVTITAGARCSASNNYGLAASAAGMRKLTAI